MKKTVLVIGASRGIGSAIIEHFSKQDIELFGVSRSPSSNCIWIEANIATKEGIEKISNIIGDKILDALIFASGRWEIYGFMQDFDFRKTKASETHNIMDVNVIAPIEISKVLSKNLSLSQNPRAIYLGALCGLENKASKQVAYTASKFALRGAIQALSIALKEENIGFTTLNPGNVATPEVLLDIKEGRFKEQTPIPMEDIISSIEWILSLSNSVEVQEINISQK